MSSKDRDEDIVKKSLLPDSTLENIGREYGISRQRVAQIIQGKGVDRMGIIAKLKEHSEKFRCVICGEVKSGSRVGSPYCSAKCRRIAGKYDFDSLLVCKYCGKPFFPFRNWKSSQTMTADYCCMDHYIKSEAHPSYVEKYEGGKEGSGE